MALRLQQSTYDFLDVKYVGNTKIHHQTCKYFILAEDFGIILGTI